MRTGKRMCLLFALLLVAALSMHSACGHKDFGPYDLIQEPGEWGEVGPDYRYVYARVASVGIHRIDIDFNGSMSPGSVSIQVADQTGNEIRNVSSGWLAANRRLVLRGPFAFCSRYYVTILAGSKDAFSIELDQDLTLDVITGRNPYNFDLDTACRADMALSPIFTGGTDGAIITGEMMALGDPHETWRRSDLDSTGVMYFDHSQYFESGGPMVIVPDLVGTGRPAAAKLFSIEERDEKGVLAAKHYELMVWSEHRPRDDMESASFVHTITGNNKRGLKGPYPAGDLDGDGVQEIILSEEIPFSNGSIMQRVYVLKAAAEGGLGAPLEDASVIVRDIGFPAGETVSPFVPIGDFNNDGRADLAAMRCFLFAGVKTDCEVIIALGADDLKDTFSEAKFVIVRGYPGRVMADLAAGDVNGDGVPDLLVAELQVRHATTGRRLIKPRIGVFFGGGSLENLSMIAPHSALIFHNTDATEVAVRSTGDFDGDGIDDIAMHIVERDTRNRITSSKIYLFAGRRMWTDGYFLSSNVVIAYNLMINAAGFGDLNWAKFNPVVGDINNDGFYDMVIVAENGSELNAYVFLGKNRYSATAWKLDLEDADVIWTFDGNL